MASTDSHSLTHTHASMASYLACKFLQILRQTNCILPLYWLIWFPTHFDLLQEDSLDKI